MPGHWGPSSVAWRHSPDRRRAGWDCLASTAEPVQVPKDMCWPRAPRSTTSQDKERWERPDCSVLVAKNGRLAEARAAGRTEQFDTAAEPGSRVESDSPVEPG